jgi:hypothetical protein
MPSIRPSTGSRQTWGGAVWRPSSERPAGPTALIEAADRALYLAKDQGRDRLAMSAPVLTLVPAASGACGS